MINFEKIDHPQPISLEKDLAHYVYLFCRDYFNTMWLLTETLGPILGMVGMGAMIGVASHLSHYHLLNLMIASAILGIALKALDMTLNKKKIPSQEKQIQKVDQENSMQYREENTRQCKEKARKLTEENIELSTIHLQLNPAQVGL